MAAAANMPAQRPRQRQRAPRPSPVQAEVWAQQRALERVAEEVEAEIARALADRRTDDAVRLLWRERQAGRWAGSRCWSRAVAQLSLRGQWRKAKRLIDEVSRAQLGGQAGGEAQAERRGAWEQQWLAGSAVGSGAGESGEVFREVQVDEDAFGLAVMAAARSGCAADAAELLAQMLREGHLPRVAVWSAVVSRMGRDPALAAAAVRLFRDCCDVAAAKSAPHMRPDTAAFNAAINAAVTAGDLPLAERLLGEGMAGAGVTPDAISFNILIKGRAAQGMPDRAHELLRHMLVSGVAWHGKRICGRDRERHGRMGRGGRDRERHGRMGRGEQAGRSPQWWQGVWRAVQHHGAHGAHYRVAAQHLTSHPVSLLPSPSTTLQSQGVQPDAALFNSVVAGYAHGVQPDAASFNLVVAGYAHGVQPDAASFNSVVAGYVACGMMGEAQALVQTMWHLGEAQGEGRGEGGKEGEVEGEGEEKGVVQGEEGGKRRVGVGPNVRMLSILIKGLVASGDLTAAFEWFERMKQRADTAPNHITYATLMHALVSSPPHLIPAPILARAAAASAASTAATPATGATPVSSATQQAALTASSSTPPALPPLAPATSPAAAAAVDSRGAESSLRRPSILKTARPSADSSGGRNAAESLNSAEGEAGACRGEALEQQGLGNGRAGVLDASRSRSESDRPGGIVERPNGYSSSITSSGGGRDNMLARTGFSNLAMREISEDLAGAGTLDELAVVAARQLLQEMRARGVAGNTAVLNVLVKAHCDRGQMGEVEALLREMGCGAGAGKQRRVQGTGEAAGGSQGASDGPQRPPAAREAATDGASEAEIPQGAAVWGVRPNAATFATIIAACGRAGTWKGGQGRWSAKGGAVRGAAAAAAAGAVQVYTALISALGQAPDADPARALSVFEDMLVEAGSGGVRLGGRESGGGSRGGRGGSVVSGGEELRVDAAAWGAVIDSQARAGLVDQAWSLHLPSVSPSFSAHRLALTLLSPRSHLALTSLSPRSHLALTDDESPFSHHTPRMRGTNNCSCSLLAAFQGPLTPPLMMLPPPLAAASLLAAPLGGPSAATGRCRGTHRLPHANHLWQLRPRTGNSGEGRGGAGVVAASIAPTPATYGSLVRALAAAERAGEALVLWRDLKERLVGAEGSAVMDGLMLIFMQAGYFQRALEVVGAMERAGLAPDRLKYKRMLITSLSSRRHRALSSLSTTTAVPDDFPGSRGFEALKFWLGLPNRLYESDWSWRD
ncbi:unnamed protein product [Closterium sp. NIES-64]|nr:unnamed protein product [Closterium sp. NIES-64]